MERRICRVGRCKEEREGKSVYLFAWPLNRGPTENSNYTRDVSKQHIQSIDFEMEVRKKYPHFN